ncbi:MAG TPA: MarR family winged helix-turn-helix transcriptional regulator [Thermoanaerobaculia bacterium]|nr:MarR family winged helix-turn-helix transcriptional regulator [Thermoanaerobaculia bacterium]
MPKSTPPTRPDERRILDAVRVLVREIRLASTATHHGEAISAAQAFVLQTLLDSPGLRINDLAEQTSTDQSSVSVVVQKLVDSGLVTKQRSATDARAFEVHLTAAGRAFARRTPVAPQLRLLDGIRKLNAGERAQLAALLEQWLQALGIADSSPPMLGEDRKGRGRDNGPARRKNAG